MDSRTAIETSFMELVAETPFPKLTIARICKHADVPRKRFYTHFANKEAVVESLFEQHAIEPMRSINRQVRAERLFGIKETINELFYEGIYKHRNYYTNLARTPGGVTPHFVEPATRVLCRWNDYMLSATNSPVDATDEEYEYISYFFSASGAMMLQKWINDGFALSPERMALLHHRIISPYWESRVFGPDR